MFLIDSRYGDAIDRFSGGVLFPIVRNHGIG